MLRTDPPYAAKAARVSALAKDVTEYLGVHRASSRASVGAASPSPIMPPARCNTGRKSPASRKNYFSRPALRSKMCRKDICAAARLAPTTSCSRFWRGVTGRARSPISNARARCDRRRQYRLYHPDRRWHKCPGRAYGRVARLARPADRCRSNWRAWWRVGRREPTRLLTDDAAAHCRGGF